MIRPLDSSIENQIFLAREALVVRFPASFERREDPTASCMQSAKCRARVGVGHMPVTSPVLEREQIRPQ